MALRGTDGFPPLLPVALGSRHHHGRGSAAVSRARADDGRHVVELAVGRRHFRHRAADPLRRRDDPPRELPCAPMGLARAGVRADRGGRGVGDRALPHLGRTRADGLHTRRMGGLAAHERDDALDTHADGVCLGARARGADRGLAVAHRVLAVDLRGGLVDRDLQRLGQRRPQVPFGYRGDIFRPEPRVQGVAEQEEQSGDSHLWLHLDVESAVFHVEDCDGEDVALVEEAALVTEILQDAPTVRILATSRQRLDQPGETLFHLSSLMFEELRARIRCEATAGNKLRAVFRYFESYIKKPVVKGGCPLMNAAIEADDTNPALRKEAIKILDILRDSLTAILKNGIRFKQIRADTDLDYYATLVIASLEGAIMMSKLRGDNQDINRVIRHLENEVKKIET